MRPKFSSEADQSARLNSHGKITSLATKFTMEDPNTPFSIYVKKIVADPEIIDIVVNCKLMLDFESSNFPVALQNWTSGNIIEIGIAAIDLAVYDVYWASGFSQV